MMWKMLHNICDNFCLHLSLNASLEGSLALDQFKLVFWYVLTWSEDINIGWHSSLSHLNEGMDACTYAS